MGYFQSFIRQFRARLFLVIFINNALILTDWYIVDRVVNMTGWWALAAIAVVPLITLGVIPWLSTRTLTQPTKFLWQAILHIAPGTAADAPAPKPEQLHLGRELVTNLVNQLYQLTSVVQSMEQSNARAAQDLRTNFIANSLPLPLIVLDREEKILYANEATGRYLNMPASELTEQNVYTALDMSFTNDDTLTAWLKTAKGKSVTANHSWERVRIGLPGAKDGRQFDMAAYYNQGNPLDYETLLILFDHTEVYSQDDQGMGFVALAVHELRTPLTLLRGYIEVFDDEVGPSLNPEMRRFMQQMNAAAQQLSAFVGNILNVAKIEDNQLTLQLHEEKWPELIDAIVRDLSLRARVRNITIKTDIAPNLPTAGVDRYGIYEVVANLLDNAIKYSQEKNEIWLSSRLNQQGLIETSIRDAGQGIDASILPYIFDKFYRNHRNRAQIGGTGLGLYLTKTIVDAHGGNISVNSKPGEGSTFTFTVMLYSKLEENRKADNNKNITRSAHGWIKNHSMYRD